VAAVSPVVGATVEDIKAAAATYLRIVNEYNAALHAYGKAVQPTYAPSVPASWRSAARDYSAAETKAAAQLRAYGAWPQSDLRRCGPLDVEAESLRGGSTPPKTGLLWP